MNKNYIKKKHTQKTKIKETGNIKKENEIININKV